MKIVSLIISLFMVSFLSVAPVRAVEMNMHEIESQGARAKDMGMTDAEHRAIEMKAHQKYDAAVKMAEKEYALAIKKAAKTKNSPAAIKTAKVKLQKAKAVADATYKKEKNSAMKNVGTLKVKKEATNGKKLTAPMKK